MARFRTLEQFEFHHTLEETPGTSLVIFTTRGCGACRRYKAVLRDYVQRYADLNVFEVDAERDLAVTREFDVFHLPALFLYVDGRYHGAVHGEAHPERLRAAIQRVLAAPAEEAP